MQIDYILVFIIGVAQMILGMIWYGPLFGKFYMKLNHVHGFADKTAEEVKRIKKETNLLYIFNFLLSLISIMFLAIIIKNTPDISGISLAIAMWIGFVVPIQGGASLWMHERTNWEKMNLFIISAGYQLFAFIIAGYLLANFG